LQINQEIIYIYFFQIHKKLEQKGAAFTSNPIIFL